MTARLRFPRGLNPERFLAEHWQRAPLLLPGGIEGFDFPLTPEELAGLACEPEVESRLVLERAGERPWEVRHGPFAESDFAELPDDHWTLLVQDVEKWVPEVAELLRAFGLLPSWRLDDVMVSYAADGGSVGPHVDEYDVFLVQGLGRRRWQIDPIPGETDCVPGLDLRILARFEPRETYVLGPGDVLYLPPGVPHWGVAQGPCMTWSVGFRAPAWRELAVDWSDFVGERLLAGRYADPGIEPQAEPGEIRPEVFGAIRDRLTATLTKAPEDMFRDWLGRQLTEPKEHLRPEPAEVPLTGADLREALACGARLHRHPMSRLAWCRGPEGTDLLFANGESYPLSERHRALLVLLSGAEAPSSNALAPWTAEPEALALLTRLVNDGAYVSDE